MDTSTPKQVSALMSRIRSKDTKPEKVVRSILHRLGFRFRLHRRDLPGCPDIVLPKYHKIILVQGCFWHGHDCPLASKPKSNQDYWGPKIEANRARDGRNIESLQQQGWDILAIWECEIRARNGLEEKLVAFVRQPHSSRKA